MFRFIPLVGAVALSACTVDMTRFDREAELELVGQVAAPAAPVSVEVDSISGEYSFLAKLAGADFTSDWTLIAKPAITDALNKSGFRTELSGEGAVVTAQIKPLHRGNVAGVDRLFWKNFGMDMALVGWFRDYYDIYTHFIVNYQVRDQGRLVWEQQYRRSEKVAYNIGAFNFARYKIMSERAQELFQVELTRATAQFAADFSASGVALSGVPVQPVAAQLRQTVPVAPPPQQKPVPVSPAPAAVSVPPSTNLPAAPPQPLQSGQIRVAKSRIPAAARPLRAAGDLEFIPAGAQVDLGSSVANAEGTWWFVSSGVASGWVPASQLSQALQ